MLVADNLVKTFSKKSVADKALDKNRSRKIEFNAVDGISLQVEPGEIVGILGPNGAGKTTFLRMLATLMNPTSGEVYIMTDNGQKITDPLKIKENIGYLSGNTRLYGRLYVREMLEMFAGIYGMPQEEISERVEKINKLLGLSDFIDNKIEKLSTGQTQRASIARCIVHDPSIYIFDEPTLGLDIISSSAIIEFMKREKENGKTVIYSTHYMEEAEYLCDRIIMLSKGRQITNMSPEDLKADTGTSNMREAFYEVIKREGITDEN
ncbi:MAG: ATP-binding cassette domain-containing protein [Eubacterium sp.]|nr:ATP-binding cassette domain-containing protein [Eubacterium sp.]